MDAIDREKVLEKTAKLSNSYSLSLALNRGLAMTDEDKTKIECWEKIDEELEELHCYIASLPSVQTQEGEDEK